MKVYKGRRLGTVKDTGSDVVVTVQEIQKDFPGFSDIKGEIKNLKHHVYHSPTGFSWGYGGSGPADLACSILWDLLGKEPDMQLYQAFKHRFVANWGDEWEINERDIRGWFLVYGWKYGRPESLLNEK